LFAVALALMLSALPLGLTARVGAQATPDATPAGDRFTPEEVAAATGNHLVVPIYAVPKQLKEKYTLAFLNPGMSIPFFKDWSDGMHAAAEFYGVEFLETDAQLQDDQIITQFETIAIREPDVIGSLTIAGPALKARADALGIPVIPIDIPIEGNPYFLGIPNEKAGQMGGELLAEAGAEKVAGDWAGRNVIYVGLGESTCEPCETRVRSGLDAVREKIDISDENVVMLDTEGRTEKALTMMTDTLTAHPDDVMVLLAMNDEAGVGALQAIKAAGRTADAVLVMLGADQLGRDAMRNDTEGVLVAMVDFNPWAEGWNWVEAAIAVAEGEEFAPYDIKRVVTRENIDEYFPEDQQ
jgi:ribose transport system substrate-binding protein